METPSQATSQIVPNINDLSPHGKPSFLKRQPKRGGKMKRRF
jgi:hypothetical protein